MNRQILRLAIPNILSNLSVPLLGVVDTALMGHQDTIAYIAAIGLAEIIFNMLYWSVAFLRMGVTGLTAQAHGRNDREESMLILGRGVFLGLLIGILFIVLQKPILASSLYFMDPSPFAESLIRQYFGVRIFTAPATLALMAFHGWFLGRQNSVFPLILAIGVNVINLGGNLFFLFTMGLGIEGLAWGTLIAQYIGFGVAGLLFVIKYRDELAFWSWKAFLKLKAIGKFFELNIALFIRGLVMVAIFFYFLSESSRLGEEMLAVNNLYKSFLMIMSFGLDGFAFAAESLVGKFKGANDSQNLKKSIRYLFVWSLGLGVIYALFYGFQGPWILAQMTDKVEVLTAAEPFLIWVVVYSLISSIAFMWDGIYFGVTASWPLTIITLISGLFFFGSYFLLKETYGNHALWFAMLIFVTIRAIGPTLLARRVIYAPLKN